MLIGVGITLQGKLGATKMKLLCLILVANVPVMQGFCAEPRHPQAITDGTVFRQAEVTIGSKAGFNINHMNLVWLD